MLRQNREYFNWRKWTGPEGQDPPSERELREEEKKKKDAEAEEARRAELDIQGGKVSRSLGETLNAVDD